MEDLLKIGGAFIVIFGACGLFLRGHKKAGKQDNPNKTEHYD